MGVYFAIEITVDIAVDLNAPQVIAPAVNRFVGIAVDKAAESTSCGIDYRPALFVFGHDRHHAAIRPSRFGGRIVLDFLGRFELHG